LTNSFFLEFREFARVPPEHLSAIDTTSQSVQNLKVDPASKVAVEKMAELLTKFEQAKEANAAAPAVDAAVYFDDKQLPLALLIDGDLLWAAYWW
jgi:hypothetical protein